MPVLEDVFTGQLKKRIVAHARRDPLPGMSSDETVAEMLEVLWRASETFNGSGTFDGWFFVCWRRHKADRLRRWFAKKRGEGAPLVPIEDRLHPHAQSAEDEYLSTLAPPYVDTANEVEVAVWQLLASGERPGAVRETVGLSRRTYEKLVTQWRERTAIESEATAVPAIPTNTNTGEAKTMAIGRKQGSRSTFKKNVKKGGDGGQFLRTIPEDGITVRFMEEPEEWVSYMRYYDEDNGGYIPMEDGEKAPKGIRVQQRYALNALDVEAGKVVVLDMPKSLAKRLVKYLDKYDTLLDRDYELSRSGEGFDTEYELMPEPAEKRNLTKLKGEIKDVEEFLLNLRDVNLNGSDEEDDEDEAPKKGRPAKKSAAKAQAEEDDEDGEEIDLEAFGGAADEGEEDAIEALEALAEEHDLDPEDYPTWAELAEALAELVDAEEDEDEEEDDAEEDAEEDEEEDEEGDDEEVEWPEVSDLKGMSVADLKEWAEFAEIDPVPGTKVKLVAALTEFLNEQGDDEEPDDEEDGDDEELDEAALKKMGLSELRELCEEFEIDHDGMKKADMVEALLESAEDEDE